NFSIRWAVSSELRSSHPCTTMPPPLVAAPPVVATFGSWLLIATSHAPHSGWRTSFSWFLLDHRFRVPSARNFFFFFFSFFSFPLHLYLSGPLSGEPSI